MCRRLCCWELGRFWVHLAWVYYPWPQPFLAQLLWLCHRAFSLLSYRRLSTHWSVHLQSRKNSRMRLWGCIRATSLPKPPCRHCWGCCFTTSNIQSSIRSLGAFGSCWHFWPRARDCGWNVKIKQTRLPQRWQVEPLCALTCISSLQDISVIVSCQFSPEDQPQREIRNGKNPICNLNDISHYHLLARSDNGKRGIWIVSCEARLRQPFFEATGRIQRLFSLASRRVTTRHITDI